PPCPRPGRLRHLRRPCGAARQDRPLAGVRLPGTGQDRKSAPKAGKAGCLMSLYSFEERRTALEGAVRLLEGQTPPPTPALVLMYANDFLGWLSGARLVLAADPRTYQQGNPAISQATRYLGGNVQLTDTQQVTLSVEPEDSKGFATSDTLT